MTYPLPQTPLCLHCDQPPFWNPINFLSVFALRLPKHCPAVKGPKYYCCPVLTFCAFQSMYFIYYTNHLSYDLNPQYDFIFYINFTPFVTIFCETNKSFAILFNMLCVIEIYCNYYLVSICIHKTYLDIE